FLIPFFKKTLFLPALLSRGDLKKNQELVT
ncbi:hypothetical protein LCGC14_2548050, partial [marine sediment metagenome]